MRSSEDPLTILKRWRANATRLGVTLSAEGESISAVFGRGTISGWQGDELVLTFEKSGLLSFDISGISKSRFGRVPPALEKRNAPNVDDVLTLEWRNGTKILLREAST